MLEQTFKGYTILIGQNAEENDTLQSQINLLTARIETLESA